MKQFRRCAGIFILFLLFVSIAVPISFLSGKLQVLSFNLPKEFIEDLSSIKYRTDFLKLNAIEQEEGKGLTEPTQEVYIDVNFDGIVTFNSSDENIKFDESIRSESSGYLSERNETNHDAKGGNGQSQQQRIPLISEKKEEIGYTTSEHAQDVRVKRAERSVDQLIMAVDYKLKELKDQLIRARAYLSFASPDSNSHLVKELKLRIKELEGSVGEATKDSDLSKRALQRMRSTEVTLQKASRIYPDCSIMVKKLRAMTHNAEEQVRTQKIQEAFLVQLAGRTTPKGLHCLSMRLTAEYFALQPEERELPRHREVHDTELYHFAVFSDNVMACAVVVDSTISTSTEPEKIIFHVVTNSLNFAAISMWFLLNPPAKATVQVQSMDNFDWLSTKYEEATIHGHNSQDPRYTSALNHLRFYLPDIFPMLNKIVLLDHDVVVQRDLTGLWKVDMMGKVNGAVETCREGDPSSRRMDLFINFSDPMVAKRFDVNACTWAFGLNVFDLKEWRRRNLTGVYLKYLKLGKERPLWKAGSLPLGWVTFYKHTRALDRKWHVHGLGYHSGISQEVVERAVVIHYDGVLKPWLDIGLEKYKKYWRKHVKYQHPYLQQCNIHE